MKLVWEILSSQIHGVLECCVAVMYAILACTYQFYSGLFNATKSWHVHHNVYWGFAIAQSDKLSWGLRTYPKLQQNMNNWVDVNKLTLNSKNYYIILSLDFVEDQLAQALDYLIISMDVWGLDR